MNVLSDPAAELAGFTVDAFHRGAFHLVQPARGAHRAGMDAMMLAAAVPSTFAGRVADLGAGAGAAGLAIVSRCVGAHATLVEKSPEMADCARRTIAIAQNVHLANRVELLAADVTLTGRQRIAAGLGDGTFDFAVMNPPFNAPGDRPSPDPMRRSAHVMEDGLFESWLRTAAAVVRPRGGLALIARPQSLRMILDALDGRFGDARIIAIHPRIDEPAIRIVIRATRGSRASLSLIAPLVIHDAGSDRFSASADAINNGRASLFGD